MVRGHRDDIDGLRAVAILPVLFFHAGLWPFRAGFAGVDVFFVISGYLITGLILRAQDGQGFSLVGFYDRRIRRILPALCAVLAVCALVAPFILLPDELKLFGTSLLASTVFAANLFYWNAYSSYFAPDAELNPLRHVWSLSVEEQFYLFWPLLLMLIARLRRPALLPWIVAALAGVSLTATLFVAQTDGNAAFYLLPFRAWQLLAGALLATGALTPTTAPLPRNALAVAGLSIALAAMCVDDGLARFHALNSIGATLGAALLLYAADGGPNLASSALATRLPVFIGRISYSLYLWHWPAFVFARLALNRDLTVLESAALLGATFAASVLSWVWIEQPIRRRRSFWRGLPASFPIAAAASVPLLTAALLFDLSGGWPQRLPPALQRDARDVAEATTGSWCRIHRPDKVGCVLGGTAAKGELILWGDSHARALIPGMTTFAAERGLRLRVFTEPSCAALPGLTQRGPRGGPNRRCAAFNRDVLAAIENDRAVRMLILEGHWQVVVTERRIDPPFLPPMARALASAVGPFARRGIPVILIGNVPRLPANPWHCYGRARFFGRDASACEAFPRAAVGDIGGETDAMLARFAAQQPSVRYFDPSRVLCPAATCRAVADGRMLYGDEQHLAPAGAHRVVRALSAALGGGR